MSCEITVKIKDSEKSMSEKTVIYSENVVADYTDLTIDKLVSKAIKNFGDYRFESKLTVTIKLIQN